MKENHDIKHDVEMIRTFLDSPRIRKEYQEGKPYYCLLDVIVKMTGTIDPKDYFKKLKMRDRQMIPEWDTLIKLMPTQTQGGVQRLKFVDSKALFRIIQIVPGEKAHALKCAMARIVDFHFQP